MLNSKFKHSIYFIGTDMTVKQFLDKVLACSGDWVIKKKPIISDNLLADRAYKYYLSCYDNGRTRGGYLLDKEDIAYLAEHNDYFKKALTI